MVGRFHITIKSKREELESTAIFTALMFRNDCAVSLTIPLSAKGAKVHTLLNAEAQALIPLVYCICETVMALKCTQRKNV